jgi:hypothetical protein
MNLISQKKQIYPISEVLRKYLYLYGRNVVSSLTYKDLMNYENFFTVYDRDGNDTFWSTVIYNHSMADEINDKLKHIYAILKSGGDVSVINHLYIDRIDFCLYANTGPFRVRVVNRLNDNFDYFYVKKADASRIYGLELEHLLSPNHISYFVSGDTLIEEHIIGIPADQFLTKNSSFHQNFEETRLAKEFVKFNERCFVRLLGDMHSSNFVIDVTPDFETTHYRMRSIDFDQQSYEKRKSVYMPQFFKQNLPFVELVQKHLTLESIQQYQREERSLIFNRIRNTRYQIKDLIDVMCKERLAPELNIVQLREELSKHYKALDFLKCQTMGHIVRTSLKILIKENMTRTGF